ncbi:Tetratricopeptide TPR_2 [Trichodesmium erythraeum IMS101]|uniref:Tetratricopeptide TPR_2 n=1 Tax=Trichodesmium erythraeum (strain IMS101) TaxID=203124 RepID=Q10ZH4_TRIEI|nr:tetratricopeptide repeat protein [Trichodesmium sp. MAG_R01]
MGNEVMSAGQLLKQANQLKRAGRLDEAIALYYQVIEINPNFAWAYNNLGDALVKQGNLDEAVAYYFESLKLNPNSAWLLYGLGEALAKQGNLEAAIEYLQKAIKTKPDFYKFYSCLGFILAANNNLNEAVVNIYKSLRLNKNCWWSHYFLSQLLIEKGDLHEAFYNYAKAIELNPIAEKKSLIHKNKSSFISLLEKTDVKISLLEEIKNLKIHKILLTTHNFKIYSGSELVTLYLAQVFADIGLDVTIVSFVTGEPMISTAASNNIEIINVIQNPMKIKQRKFDLAWCHHFPVIDYCVNDLEVNAKFMVYSSLSAYEPLEKMTYLETSDVVLFNSKENQHIQAYSLDEKYQQKIFVFNNSLPENWFLSLKQSVPGNKGKHLLPKNIAVISNHIPPEIKKLPDLLNDCNIKVKFIGLETKQELVTPKLIDTYDAVITIGHTVQKAMSRKIPVYCYDRFGGPGWITKGNLIDAEYFNFSGRCCNRKLNTESIKDEIIQGYKTAIESLNYLFYYSEFLYSTEANVLAVLQKLKLSDTTFVEKLNYHSLESYQIRKTSQLYINTKFHVGSKISIVYLKDGLKKFDSSGSQINLKTNDNANVETTNYKPKVEVLSVAKFFEYDPSLLWGFNIEYPVESDIKYEYKIPLSGWVLGKASTIIAIDVIIDDTLVKQIPLDQHRPDVAEAYPDNPSATNCGFMTEVNVDGMPVEAELSIEAVFSDDNRLPLGIVKYKKILPSS